MTISYKEHLKKTDYVRIITSAEIFKMSLISSVYLADIWQFKRPIFYFICVIVANLASCVIWKRILTKRKIYLKSCS